MSNYSALKTAIQQAVYTNGNNEITGAGLQAVLLQIVNTVGDGYVFKGVATAGTSAGTPDANVFYIAPAGTYTNFGTSYTIPLGCIGVFAWNGSWNRTAIRITDMPYKTAENIGVTIAINSKDNTINVSSPIYLIVDSGTIPITLSNTSLSYTRPSSNTESFFEVVLLQDDSCQCYNIFADTIGDIKQVFLKFSVNQYGVIKVTYMSCAVSIDGNRIDPAGIGRRLDINDIYEEGYNYFLYDEIVNWSGTYKISKLLKVTQDVDIDNVTSATNHAACCVMYDKDMVMIGSKIVQAESYGAYGSISASDLSGATFFRICGNMKRPPVFNYTPVFATAFSDEEYLTSESLIGYDVAGDAGSYSTYAKPSFNHYDECHNMEVIGLRAKFSSNADNIDIMVLDKITGKTRVIQTIPKEKLHVSQTTFTYIRLAKPIILKANEYIGFSGRVYWKTISGNTIDGSTIQVSSGDYTHYKNSVFDYGVYVRKVERYRLCKSLSVMSDSIGTTNYVTNPERVYWKALCNHTGMVVCGTSTIGGTTITRGLRATGMSFVEESRIDALAGQNGESPDIVIIQGGVNDFGSNAVDNIRPCPIGSWDDDPSDPSLSFYSSCRYLLNAIKTSYPQSNIIFCTPPKMFASGKLSSYEPLTNTQGVKMSEFVDVIKDVAKEYGAIVVDLFAELPVTKENYATYYVDTYHANDVGNELIEDLLLDKIISLFGNK